MSAEPDEIENLEFKWGIKKGVGGKNKGVHFYESFTYDGVEYTLYDCVYMHKEYEPEPYIGKLIKIWENIDKSKKVKIQWFFRPAEISEWLRDGEVLENEIFLASGAGVGLANVNPLEAIAGKCNVVCISKDCRNPQPSWEELKMADYIFYRTFDVRNYTINELDDSVGGLEIKFIFNQKENGNASSVSKVDSDRKEYNRNVVAEEFKTVKTDRNYNPLMVREDAKGKDYFVKLESSEEKVKTGHGKDFVRLDKVVKSAQDSVASDDRPSKKAKVVDSTTKFSEDKNKKSVLKRIDSDANVSKDLATIVNFSEEKTKSRLTKDFRLDKGPVKKEKPDEKTNRLFHGKLPKISADEDTETEGQTFEVNRKPDNEKSKWFRALPWEERMRSVHDKGTLVLLRNLDPEYTSGEVEDILWHAFRENCTAKMVQHTAISSSHSGQAFVIFKTREAAEKVIRKLENGCLMLPNGRPLVGCFGPPPSLPGKRSTFIGHLSIDKLKIQMQREMKEAVSTSHCSQPNTIEYEMAMEWCLLQSRSDTWWKRLHKQQGEELRKLMANLKSK